MKERVIRIIDTDDTYHTIVIDGVTWKFYKDATLEQILGRIDIHVPKITRVQ